MSSKAVYCFICDAPVAREAFWPRRIGSRTLLSAIMTVARRRPVAGKDWSALVLQCTLLLTGCVGDRGMQTTRPVTASAPTTSYRTTTIAIPDAPAKAEALLESTQSLRGQVGEAALATGKAAARQALEQGLTAAQDAATADMSVPARIVGLESGAPAFQGGALQGPLGSVAARQGDAGAEAAAHVEPAAGIGVSIQAQPGRVAAGADLGQAVRIDATSEADRRRLAAALQIVRGLSIGAASDGDDMSRAAIAWRVVQRATLSGSVGADGSRSLDLKALDQFGVSIDQEQDSLRQRLSVDIVPGLSIETSGPLDSSDPQQDDRIGVKWKLRY